MITATVAAVVFVVMLLRRRAKRRLVAGLDSDRPAYTVSAPTRYTSRLKDHRL